MKIKAINGNDYEEFLDGFFGGGEYGVSRNGKIGFDSQGNVFARNGVSATDKQLVGLKIQEQKDPMNADTYKRQAAALRKQNPSYTVREDAPLSDFEILKNPQKELGTSSPIQYASSNPTQQQLDEIKADMDAGKFNGIGLNMLRNGAPGINKAAVLTANDRQKNNNTSAPVNTTQKANTASGATTAANSSRRNPRMPWQSPAEETDDDIIKAGREHGKNILEEEFYRGYLMGWGQQLDPLSPIGNSTFLDVAKEKSRSGFNADMAAAGGATAKFAADSILDTDEASQVIQGTKLAADILEKSLPYTFLRTLAKSAGKVAPLIGIAYNISKGGLQDASNTYHNLKENNARERQANRQYEYLNNSEYKYLIDDERARDEFIANLNIEIDALQNTERLGFLPDGINEKYKEEAINTLKRIVFINRNYDYYKSKLNAKLEELLSED